MIWLNGFKGFDDDMMAQAKADKTQLTNRLTPKTGEASREQRWATNIQWMIENRWPDDVPRARLAKGAGVSEEYLSRLHNQCPKRDVPSKQLKRLCKILRVDPASIFARNPSITGPAISIEEAENLKPWGESSSGEEEALERFSSLQPNDKRIVIELISRLAGK